ncbi:hypothetical protein E3P92_03088 [Wallemia ichthyophaga]|uniref:Aqualysin-1 n=1 Tax=Wallemia ichthyophaga (strain EXF-994 / CBS 113033) TaxID=1299270 RepID=R9AEQ4_WALI9|nr:Aqualysin-1 [Wallemia ichthyophaga EXF-994]TIA98744.1 hypothetical protein E3P96_03090 [Wallemia ichthyophaga]EOR00652.1 Aqualysin-1 [Wallemia ichthyophaga EXF-994]TIB10878.1 hypothetical protein E3P92_03088 [Wallemia ichthyophaga]TIB33571.1 hypothetical protein E3P84_02130 [Wallemia ichthyophaga]TIB41398.1 hypothetical protein E3P83_02016 [Wallemia ichthyophaga]
MRIPFILTLAAAASASLLDSLSLGGGVSEGNYIMSFKEDTDQNAHYSMLEGLLGEHSTINHKYDGFFNGYALSMGSGLLGNLFDTLLADIADMEEDVPVEAYATQSDATWNLQRVNQRNALPADASPHAQDYTYSWTGAGAGVDVYVIDTGIRTSHTEFGGRASYGYNGTSGDGTDQVHHGTHVAALIGGATYGTAKEASLISVKVLNADGQGKASDVLAGVNWAANAAKNSDRPSIASLSLGGPASNAMDSIVSSATAAGVHFVVASGNYNEDACASSPARVSSAITVAASNIDDTRAPFSSYGDCVGLYAPGVDILSAGNADDQATLYLSGSSMSAPIVSGLLATLISNEGDMDAGSLQSRLLALATDDIVANSNPTDPNAGNATMAYYNPTQ